MPEHARGIKMYLNYTVAAQTDVGRTKSVNQDKLTVKVANTRYGEVAFAVICDGMGGLDQGEIAGAVTVKTFESWFKNEFPFLLKSGFSQETLFNTWGNMVNDCNNRILDYSSERNTRMGTTLTAMLFVQDRYFICHVGDCRIYEMGGNEMDGNAGGEIRQLTHDHTYVAREVARGNMTPEQALGDSRRNVLLQCIGTSGSVSPDFICGGVEDGTSFLLCTDGFRHRISEAELNEMCNADISGADWTKQNRLKNSELMNGKLRKLIQMNISRGETDNISAILIRAHR